MTNPSSQTNPLDYPRYVRGIRPALPESTPLYVEDELEKLQNSMENMAVAVVTDTTTRVQVETTERETADEALAEQITTIYADLDDVVASVVTEASARATADAALASSITSLTAAYQAADTTLQANITSEASARASADTALSSSITSLTATVGTKNRNYWQTSAPSGTAHTDGDLWFDTDDGNKPYRWNAGSTSWVASPDAQIAANSAAIVTEASARASGDSANASSITTLTTTVNGHTSTLTSYGSSISGLQAKAGVKLDVNGHVVGWELNNSGSTGDFIVRADRFAVVNSSGTDQTAVFEVVGGQVKINGAELKASSVPPTSLNVSSLDAITGTIGLLRTATSGSRVEIASNYIKIYDGSDLVVQLGNLAA